MLKIRDVGEHEVLAGRNWRLVDADSDSDDLVDWVIEECSDFEPTDDIVYSGLAISPAGIVSPILVIRELGSYEWWGDACVYAAGEWRPVAEGDDIVEEFVGEPHPEDPSWMGAYSHAAQREGFARLLRKVTQARGPGEADSPLRP